MNAMKRFISKSILLAVLCTFLLLPWLCEIRPQRPCSSSCWHSWRSLLHFSLQYSCRFYENFSIVHLSVISPDFSAASFSFWNIFFKCTHPIPCLSLNQMWMYKVYKYDREQMPKKVFFESVNKAPFLNIYMYGTLQKVMWELYLMYII